MLRWPLTAALVGAGHARDLTVGRLAAYSGIRGFFLPAFLPGGRVS